MVNAVKILSSFSPPEIIKSIVNNYRGFRSLFARIPGAALNADSNLVWLDSGCPRASWNGILRVKDAGLRLYQEVLEIIRYFNKCQRSFGCWMNPVDFPRHSKIVFQQKGFLPVEETAAMAADLENFKSSVTGGHNLTVIPVQTTQKLDDFMKIISKSFSFSAQCRQALHKLIEIMGCGTSGDLKNFVGIYNGVPAVSASLFLNSGVAGIYYIGTLPALRGKGLASELTFYLMKVIKELGFRVAVLRASRMGESIYRRLGFQELFKFSMLLYRYDQSNTKTIGV